VVEQRADGLVVGVGVFADVERRQMETGRRDRLHGRADAAAGSQLATVGGEGVRDEREIVEQFAPVGVVGPGLVGGAGAGARAGVDQLRAHARQLEAVGLLGVAPQQPWVEARQALEVSAERCLQRGAGWCVASGDREVPHQPGDHLERVGHGVLVLELQHVAGDLGGDEGVAVAVAPDPGAQPDGRGAVARRDTVLGAQRVELAQYRGQGVRDDGVEIVERVAGLVHGGGGGTAQLVGLPQQVDRLGEAGILTATRRATLRGRGGQDIGDLPQLQQHRATARLGRVGREHRPQVGRPDGGSQEVGAAPLDDGRDGLLQPSAPGLRRVERADAVHLFGGVRQLEVRGEGAHERRGLVEVEAAQRGSGRGGGVRGALRARLLDLETHLLHQVEQPLAALADEALAQQGGHAPHIGAQFEADGVGFVTGQGHPASVAERATRPLVSHRLRGAGGGLRPARRPPGRRCSPRPVRGGPP